MLFLRVNNFVDNNDWGGKIASEIFWILKNL